MKIFLCKKCDFVSENGFETCPNCKGEETCFEFDTSYFYDLTFKQEQRLTNIVLNSEEFNVQATKWIENNPILTLLLLNAIEDGYNFLFANDKESDIYIDYSRDDKLYIPSSEFSYSKKQLIHLYIPILENILNKKSCIDIMEFVGIDFIFLEVDEKEYDKSGFTDKLLLITDDETADAIYNLVSSNPDILVNKLDDLLTKTM